MSKDKYNLQQHYGFCNAAVEDAALNDAAWQGFIAGLEACQRYYEKEGKHMNNFIQNASKFDIITGRHADAGENSMLIQIVDFFDTFPTPKYKFKEVLQFKFDDVLDGPTACTDLQAQEIANALQRAKEQHMNVIVHCFAGLCRSGAVTEVGIMLGFNPPDCIRIPNSTVKNKMLKALGMKIDESTSVFAQEFYNREFD